MMSSEVQAISRWTGISLCECIAYSSTISCWVCCRLFMIVESGHEKLSVISPKDKCMVSLKDGILWNKPSNFHFTVLKEEHHIGGGSRGGNVVRMHVFGISVFKDPHETNKSRQFKAFGMLQQPVFEDADQLHQLTNASGGTMVSADGITWSEDTIWPLNIRWDTHHSLFWDEARQTFAVITRGPSPNRRTLALVRSEPGKFSGFGFAEVVATPQRPDDQMHSAQVFPYYGIYLSILTTYDANCTELAPGQSRVRRCQDHARCELAWSADLRTWKRFTTDDRQPLEVPLTFGKLPMEKRDSYEFIPLEKKTYHSNGCFAASPVQLLGQQLRVYFMGVDAPHFQNRRTAFSVAKLRPDGFAGVRPRAGHYISRLVTKPLHISGNTLVITADLATKGFIRVQLLDSQTSVPLQRQSPEQVLCADKNPCTFTSQVALSWRTLAAWEGKSLRLAFELKNATLYTFAFERRDIEHEEHLAWQFATSGWQVARSMLLFIAVTCLPTWYLWKRCRRQLNRSRQQDIHGSIPVGKPAE
mmetsp:Transcript_155341/g.498395  ORF Transcript_155341/g.498395 Transcript_155341/m.498395 type:complete len:530 (+) Transcript_155341:512-2101(+)